MISRVWGRVAQRDGAEIGMVDQSVVEQFLAAMAPQPSEDVTSEAKILSPPASKKSIIAPLVAALLLVLAALLLALTIFLMADLQRSSLGAFHIQSEVQALETHMLDAETGQRGFVITSDPRFLESYHAERTVVRLEFARLLKSPKNDLVAAQALQNIGLLWTAKLAEMESTIEAKRAGRASDAIALVSDARGKALMDGIRQDVRIIVADTEERRMATIRTFRLQEYRLVGLGLLVLGLALLVAARELYRARRSSRSLVLQQTELRSANAGLAALVDQGAQKIGNITALLDAVINTTNEAIYAKDKYGRMVFANDACLRVIGRERAMVIGFTEAEFHPDSAEAAAICANDRRVVESNSSAIMEENFASDFGPRVFLSSKAPMRNQMGEVIGLVGVSSDITARKHMETQLFISQQRFDAAISAFEGMVWTSSPSGGVLSVNAQWSILTGLPASEALGGGWRTVQHPDDIAPTLTHWQECLREVRPFIGEYRLRNREGKYRTMLVRAVPVLDPQGRVAEWVGLNIDVTEARNVALLHEAALTRLSVAMEAANTGAFEIVPDQPEASTFDGRTLEIWGRNLASGVEDLLKAIHPDDRPEVSGIFEGLHARQVSDSVEIEFRILRMDGTTRWVAMRAKIFAPAGAPIRLVGTVRDVSLRREQQDRIQFLMRELAHRSKNALAVVQAIARQTVKSSRSLEAFQASFEARVQGMARSLDLLVKYDWTAVSITELIQSQMAHIIDDVDEKISTRGPEIYLKPEAAQNIGLALHELATNAAKFGALVSDNGKIELEWGLAQSKDGTDVFKMHWREKGGPPVVPPDSHGFGHTVIHRVVQAALAGDSVLHFHDSGVQWDLVIPARFVSTNLVEGPP